MTKIFAHRGASGYAPENTLEAFALAMDIGADGIELDVQMTKDGEVVVIHDETINRVSDGKGRVKDYTLVQLREFSFDNHMECYGHVSIPTLKEVLELVRPSKMPLASFWAFTEAVKNKNKKRNRVKDRAVWLMV